MAEVINGQGAAAGAAGAGTGAAGAGGTGSAGGATGAAVTAAGGAGGGQAAGGGAAGGAVGGTAGQSVVEKGWWESAEGRLDLKIPDGLTLSPTWQSKLTDWAKAGKLSSDVVNGVLPLAKEFRDEMIAEQKKTWETHLDTQKKDLPKVFGTVEKFEQAKKDTAALYDRMPSDLRKETMDFLDSHGLLHNPTFAKFTSFLGAFLREKTSEDSSSVTGARGQKETTSTDPQQRRIRAMGYDKTFQGTAPKPLNQQ